MRLHFWNILFTIFFVLLVVLSLAMLVANNRLFYEIPVRDLVLLSLAVFRLTRLFVYDHITQFIRDWFVGAKEGTLRGTLGQLINCPWCTGLWFGWFVVTLYFATVYSWPVILILSLAAVGSLLQLLSNWIGWSAEYKKLQVQGMHK